MKFHGINLYQLSYRKGEKVLYGFAEVTIVEVKKYPHQTDLVIKQSNGKLVQVEEWRVEKI